jgi:uncharacterized protein (UPF0548 family)
MRPDLTYADIGATCPEDSAWSRHPEGYHRFERTVPIGHGRDHWESATAAVMTWEVKTRSGFAVASTGGTTHVEAGVDYRLTASLGPFRLREPVRVVAVVEQPDRVGFAYGTLAGHPVSGEEAFIVHQDPDGAVWLTLRSLTRPARGRWRLVFPAALIAQRWYRARYVRALHPS